MDPGTATWLAILTAYGLGRLHERFRRHHRIERDADEAVVCAVSTFDWGRPEWDVGAAASGLPDDVRGRSADDALTLRDMHRVSLLGNEGRGRPV